ncbi:MAG TPA: hypothetical protein VMP01_19865 [Pirellulaceae bacterium]|nr:hypothetical protein [Pirellulaceae bacterium]
MASRYHFYFWVIPLLTLGLLLIAIVKIDIGIPPLEYVTIGFWLGSMFGLTTLASAWAAFGPEPLLFRLPLSLVWVAMVIGAMLANVALYAVPASELASELVIIGSGLLAQWLLVQLPLWGLVMFYGLRLRHIDSRPQQADLRERQFGIRQLMIFTGLVGVTLGIGRILVGALSNRFSIDGEGPIFVFLAVAAIVMTLPVLLAALLPRWAVPATVGMLLIVGLTTVVEVPLLDRIHGGWGPDMWHFFWINAFTAGWIALVCVVVQRNGYRLATSRG